MTTIDIQDEQPASNIVRPIFGRPDLKHLKPITITPGVNDPWTIERREVFDKLCGEYLVLTGETMQPWSDSEESQARMEAKLDRLSVLAWEIIRGYGPAPRHLDFKFNLLREWMPIQWTDMRQFAMLESIRRECIDAYRDLA